jgi:hypothetical protein
MFLNAFSRSQAAQQSAEKRLGGVPRKGVLTPLKGYDFPRRLLFVSSAGKSACGRPSDRFPFLFRPFSFGQAKKKDNKKNN